MKKADRNIIVYYRQSSIASVSQEHELDKIAKGKVRSTKIP